MDTITTIQNLLKSNGSVLPVTVALMPSDLRLIAAAPALLEALEDLLGAVRQMPNLLMSYPSIDVITAASDAIAQAPDAHRGRFTSEPGMAEHKLFRTANIADAHAHQSSYSPA